MAHAAANIIDREESVEFAALLNGTLSKQTKLTGQVVKGRVVAVTDDTVVVDVGLKSEGRVPKREFSMPGQDPEIRAGDTVEVYVERMEDRDGYTVLSREKARREKSGLFSRKTMKPKNALQGLSSRALKADLPLISVVPLPSCRVHKLISVLYATFLRSWALHNRS